MGMGKGTQESQEMWEYEKHASDMQTRQTDELW